MTTDKIEYRKRVAFINRQEEMLLRDMVRHNIIYFDPTEAAYYPQGKSYRHGIRLYFKC